MEREIEGTFAIYIGLPENGTSLSIVGNNPRHKDAGPSCFINSVIPRHTAAENGEITVKTPFLLPCYSFAYLRTLPFLRLIAFWCGKAQWEILRLPLLSVLLHLPREASNHGPKCLQIEIDVFDRGYNRNQQSRLQSMVQP